MLQKVSERAWPHMIEDATMEFYKSVSRSDDDCIVKFFFVLIGFIVIGIQRLLSFFHLDSKFYDSAS